MGDPLRTTTYSLKSRTYSVRDQLFIQMTRSIVPESFLKGCNGGFDQDIRLLGMAALALVDFNQHPPCENFTMENFPLNLFPLLELGTGVYIQLFTQMKYSLIDISYNDNGLSIAVDRVGKTGQSYTNLNEKWEEILTNYKKCQISKLGLGLGTPRFQSNLSRFIGMLGNGAFGWNIP